MVSVAVSKLGCSPLHFVEPGVKVDGRCYLDVPLKQQLLPVMHRIAGDHCWSHVVTYVFQQDSAPAHRARDTVQLLQQLTPEFNASDLWPPNSPDCNLVDYHVWSGVLCRNEFTRLQCVTQLTSSSAASRFDQAFHIDCHRRRH